MTDQKQNFINIYLNAVAGKKSCTARRQVRLSSQKGCQTIPGGPQEGYSDEGLGFVRVGELRFACLPHDWNLKMMDHCEEGNQMNQGLGKFVHDLRVPPVCFWALKSPEPVTDTHDLLFWELVSFKTLEIYGVLKVDIRQIR